MKNKIIVELLRGLRAVRRPLRIARAARTNSGQSLIELAYMIPVLLLLTVGIIEVGRFAYYAILVANAARAGAQYATQSLVTAADTTGIATAAKNDGQNVTGLTVTSKQRCGCTGATLSNTCPATACTAPAHALVYVEVNVTGTFNSMFHYPGFPASITVNKTYDMRVAQ